MSGRFRSSRTTIAVAVTLATFVDLLAYSVAVPVLPDLAARLGASPTTIGLMFASFGVTLLAVAVPMGAVSDRVGRKAPMVAGLLTLGLATALFALAPGLPGLFAARLVQGAADGVTWVVGFALIADLFGPAERGRVMGYVMAGTNLGLMLGPSVGGWLYELGGITLPFAVVGLIAAGLAAFFAALIVPRPAPETVSPPIGAVLRLPGVLMCVLAAIAGSATLAMLEPVLPLVFDARLHLGPARVGLLFGIAATSSAFLHPLYGHMSDRYGARRLTIVGLGLSAALVPTMPLAYDATSAAVLMVAMWGALSMTVTPSLAYAAEVASAARLESFGVVYGAYNVAWGIGLLTGPAAGGFLLDRVGFEMLAILWAPLIAAVALLMWRVR